MNHTDYAPLNELEQTEESAEVDESLISEDSLFTDQSIQITRVASVPQGSITSSVINIANTILGSGMVAMPSAVAAVGLGNGIILILICATLSSFGLFLLGIIASRVGRKSSFFSCSQITYPALAPLFDLAVSVKCFGVSISYLVITGGLIPQIVLGFYPNISPESIWLNKITWITVSMLVVAPTCFLRRLDSLKYTSGFSLIAVSYLVLVVGLYFVAPAEGMPEPPTIDQITWFKFDSNMLSKSPIFVFAFTCHQNVFLN
jgi:amino acid permease